jgi:preprotein translocase subunit SecB
MKEAPISSFNFEGFKIVRSLFDRKEGELGKNFQISFQPSGIHHLKDGRFQLNLNTRIENDSQLLHIEVDAIATYKINGDDSPEILKNFFYLNAPAILFPYIRAYVSALTTLSGLAPVTLPTLNLSNLAAELEKNTRRIED